MKLQHAILLCPLSIQAPLLADAKTIFDTGISLGPPPEVTEIPSTETLWNEYINTEKKQYGKPFLFRGSSKSWPAFEKWADDTTLDRLYGNETLDMVETERKETRTKPQKEMNISKFIESYKEKGWNAVASVPQRMNRDMYLPRYLRCGGYQKKLHGAVVWWVNKGSRSVIHNDEQDAWNCMLSGQKRWILWSPKYLDKIQSKPFGWVRGGEKGDKGFKKTYGAFGGRIDVDNVDTEKYPGWDQLEHYDFYMNPGDCLFIPKTWYHTVFGSDGLRHMNTLYWFFRPDKFDKKDCEKTPEWPANMTAADCTWGWDHGSTKLTKCKVPKSSPKSDEL